MSDDPKTETGDFDRVPRRHFATLALWQEAFNERAAIYEYLGGISRKEAEARASVDVGPRPRDTTKGCSPSSTPENQGRSRPAKSPK